MWPYNPQRISNFKKKPLAMGEVLVPLLVVAKSWSKSGHSVDRKWMGKLK
jgi:hypothetical protein